MIVVLAARDDPDAEALALRWASHRAAILSPDDLSEPGWRYIPGQPEAGVAVVSRRRVPAVEIAGVLSRLGIVDEADLVRVRPSERAYVAAEMTAFLASWLNELSCPVVNLSHPGYLSGPGWGDDEWRVKAAQAGSRVVTSGVRLRPLSRSDRDESRHSAGWRPTDRAGDPLTLTVVAGRCIGRADEALCAQAVNLARLAGVDALSVTFSGSQRDSSFLSADPWPDVMNPEVADALLDQFCPGALRGTTLGGP
jgi:hypothetical protein